MKYGLGIIIEYDVVIIIVIEYVYYIKGEL